MNPTINPSLIFTNKNPITSPVTRGAKKFRMKNNPKFNNMVARTISVNRTTGTSNQELDLLSIVFPVSFHVVLL